MKLLVLALCVVAAASANVDFEATVVRSDFENAADGFKYAYETSNGIAGQASGALKKEGDHEFLGFQGTYQYQSPEGPVQVSYVADENGYQPQSDLLPVPPPIPEAIARSLQYIADHPPPPQKN